MDRPPTAKRTIMIAVDDADHSKYAFKWSLDNIVRPNGEDWVLLVTCKGGSVDTKATSGKPWAEIPLSPVGGEEQPRSPTTEGSKKKKEELFNAELSRMENLLSTYRMEMSQRFIPCKLLILQGDPKVAIVGKADEVRADVVIMGSRSMGKLRKAIIGSVSDYCVHNAPCPVLIVRKPTGY